MGGSDLSLPSDGAASSWDTGDSFAAPITDSTVTGDLATASAATDNTGTGSSWTGFLQDGLSQILALGIQRDKAASQAQVATQQAQALAMTQAKAGTVATRNGSQLLLVAGGLVLVGLVVMSHSKG